MSWDALSLGIIGPAFLAGLIVLATHVPLGRQVLARGIVFIDLAIAQIAGLGVILAHLVGWDEHPLTVQLAAVAAALAGAAALTFTERKWPQVQEALIGVSFVFAASLGVLLLAHDPHGSERMQDLLAGQVLWVSYAQLLPAALLTLVLLVVWFGFHARLGRAGFYVVFALAVTASVQLVGVYLVFASLIVPALASQRATRWPLLLGYLTGAAGYAMGLVLSSLFDLPSGAVIVCSIIAAALLVAATKRPARG